MAGLTDTAIRKAKATGKAYRMADGHGLFLEVTATGKKVWRYRCKGAPTKSGQMLLTLGEYPLVSLADARARREELRKQIADGQDPREVARAKAEEEKALQENTLERVAAAWFERWRPRVEVKTAARVWRVFEMYIFPIIGQMRVSAVKPRDVMEVLANAEKKAETRAKEIKSLLTRVFSYAIQTGVSETNPSAAMVSRDVLRPHVTRHYAALDIGELPAFLKAVETDGGGFEVKAALKLIMMLFMRKSELSLARWEHIDLGRGLWTIPAENTKKGRAQVYPLPHQAVAILQELRRHTWQYGFAFCTGHHGKDAPLGHGSINAVITRAGYHKRVTVHGFRAMAASWLDEKGYNRLAIERQLSHVEKGQTAQAYHRADYMEERRRMLQDWADYLESVSGGVMPQDGRKVA